MEEVNIFLFSGLATELDWIVWQYLGQTSPTAHFQRAYWGDKRKSQVDQASGSQKDVCRTWNALQQALSLHENVKF